ncbi:MAG: hypothetical protein QM711_01860 [Micropruina sp.]|uniref:hypothetical protein n=1 Tax=Micropruina sp. TaxID=2737536 RepID=UPI0039E3931C
MPAPSPQETPSSQPVPVPQPPDGSGPWPPVDSLSPDRGLSAALPMLAGAVLVMGLTLLLRPPRSALG